ncbi:MAG: alpha-L-fucosidase [Clostridia bacterium]
MSDHIHHGVHGCSAEDAYVAPKDPLLQERLSWFQDQKLALMMHFGIYSQLGICESWPLSDEDADWSRKAVDWETDSAVFRKQYVDLNRSFHPVRLQPDVWAQMAKRNGFRYLIFTTKHHDGFCMYDTKWTDYKVTSPDCPFHAHRYADITRHVFDAFRAEGIGIAAYFSKPDWHCPWYWAPGQERPIGAWRNPTYDPRQQPALWEQYVQFTHRQMLELIERYGRIDILWLDGGQVNPANHQDIRLSEFVARARQIQPWLLTADRTVGGENENYITPEQSIPDHPIHVPWESCITIGDAFAYRYEDTYKSPRTLVHLLIDIVCRGGNLALNIAPQPDGRLPKGAIDSANGLGDWLRVHGEAIYGTRMCPPYETGAIAFTRKDKQVYALYRLAQGEPLGRTLQIPWLERVTRVTLLDGVRPLDFQTSAAGITIFFPPDVVGTSPLAPAFRLENAS